MAYFGKAKCQQTSFASIEKDLKSTICQQIPLFMKLSNLFMWQCHEERVTVSQKCLLLNK